MENLQDKKDRGNISSSALFHTVNGALFHTVRSARESLTVRFSTPSMAFFSFPTVRFSTPYIEYAIHGGFLLVSLLSQKAVKKGLARGPYETVGKNNRKGKQTLLIENSMLANFRGGKYFII
ncbi:MAG: hypothetical protein ABII06_06265 [Pseudomonadota bacterium]